MSEEKSEVKLCQLRILLTVAQRDSIHKVSRGLHTSQLALSKTIAKLERGPGATLLSRSVRGVSLTVYGMALVRWVSVVEQELRHALGDIETIRDHAEAGLNIGFIAIAPNGLLPDVMAALRTHFPNVAPHGFGQRSQQILEGLREGRIDLGLISANNRPDASSFQQEPLFSVPIRLAVYPDHPLRCTHKLHSPLDVNRPVLDPLDNPGSLMISLVRLYRLEIPHRTMRGGFNLLGLQLITKTDLVSMQSGFVFTNTLGPLRTILGALEVLPVEDGLLGFSVYIVYRSAGLMMYACTRFSKEIRRAAQCYRHR